ncbi:MAG: substrate-binding domain-containing protein [Treponema sp.]|nr:substrate-binding domain-containing protein [Treponema sp.]
MKKYGKFFYFYIVLLILLLTVLSSCSKQTSNPPENSFYPGREKSGPLIGFSIDTLAIERWLRDLDVFMNTAKELGAQVIVQNSGNSIEEQNRQISYLIDRNVDVIVIVAKKEDTLSASIKRARTRGIPVIAYDRLITNADINMFMTVDSEKVGEYMTKGLLAVKPYGNWFCILGPLDDHNTAFIQEGVRKILTGNKSVRITFTSYTDGWNYDLSYTAMVTKLKEGSIPDAVICGNDAIANSVIRAVSETNTRKHIAVSGQDADIAGCQNIVQGKQTMTVYKPVTRLAQLAAEYACRLAKGESVQNIIRTHTTINNGFADIPVVWLDPIPVTVKNIDEVVINSGFHTRGEVYKNIPGLQTDLEISDNKKLQTR